MANLENILKSLFTSSPLLGKHSTAVGLSIGSSSIKLVELKKERKSWKLLHFGVVQLPEDAIINREIINPLMVTDSIKLLLSQIQLKNHVVCTSLSGTSLLIRRMSVEVPHLKDVKDQVFWEAEQYLPFDVADVVMDFQILSRTKQGKTDVLFVAVKKSILDVYIASIIDAGLNPAVVDVDFFALQNLFEINYPQYHEESVALVDLGASALKIVIVQSGVPVFTRDSALGGKALTVEIQKNLSVSFSDAEALKIGANPQGKVPREVNDLIHVMADNFAIEIKKAIDYYNASVSGVPVALVLLTGGSSQLSGLSKIIEDGIKLPTQLWNPFNTIVCDPAIFNAEYLNQISPIAAIPIGLALRASAK